MSHSDGSHRSVHRTAEGFNGRTILWVFTSIFLFRLVNALSIRTFFQPDEYFQSLEPAWNAAFGQESGAWITWEWKEHLRSSVHPLLFAAIYKAADQICVLLQTTPGVRADMLLAAPKILQASIAAVGDLFTWRFASKLYGHASPSSKAALALTMLSPWQWFCSVRTLSNSLETALTIVALYYWPWKWFLQQTDQAPNSVNGPRSSRTASRAVTIAPEGLHTSLCLAALACVLRPTNIIVWAAVSLTLLYRHGSIGKLLELAFATLRSGSLALVPCVCLDRAFYATWAFPPLKFLYFNVVRSLAVFYGTNRLDYYFTEGLPLLLTTALPFAAIGLWRPLRRALSRSFTANALQSDIEVTLTVAVCIMTLAMTMVAHKEVRFLYPLLPILHILAAEPLAEFFRPFPVSTSRIRIGLMAFMVVINVYIAWYVSFVHQRGVIDVLRYLRHEQEATLASRGAENVPANATIAFLMPCHSTPWRSHFVHAEIDAWALTCEPPLNLSIPERQSYLDEADIFYNDPRLWLESTMADVKAVKTGAASAQGQESHAGERRVWPQYLVFFQHLVPIMDEVLAGSAYQECWRGFNTHWHDDSRRHGDVIVWCLR